MDNEGLEVSPVVERKPYPRSDTSLTQVDLDILSRQQDASLGDSGVSHRPAGDNDRKDSVVGHGVANFFGRPMTTKSASSWNPFRKKSGILNVIHAQSKRNRMVSKHGRINTYVRNVDEVEPYRFLKDFFTSLIELSWWWTIFWFSASFFFSWLLFGVVWFLVAVVHRDLDPEYLAAHPDHVVCVDNIEDFTTAFLFSVETQHTIGYGGRATSNQCAFAIIVMCVQSIVGVIISACMAGIFFAKLTKPRGRGATVVFSRNALISMRDGVLYLQLRLGDLRQNQLIGCMVFGHFLSKRKTTEGEVIPYHLSPMEFGCDLDGSCNIIQPFWPLIVSHRIDTASPLYTYSARDITNGKFEILVTVEGASPETGNSVQTRTSYMPQDIIWGHRFEHSCVAYDKMASKYAVSYDAIDSIVQDETPRHSAQTLASGLHAIKEE